MERGVGGGGEGERQGGEGGRERGERKRDRERAGVEGGGERERVRELQHCTQSTYMYYTDNSMS